MEDTALPYELPEVKDHSFFFVEQTIAPNAEVKLHCHDAWELYYVVRGYGNRLVGDTITPFATGDVVLIPPGMHHKWEYAKESAGSNGCICYLMVAFNHKLIEHSIDVFPEFRNRMAEVEFPVDAIKFGTESSRILGKRLLEMNNMDELNRLCSMFGLLPIVFKATDYTISGKLIKIDKDVRRMQQINTYVMTYYANTISLADIASEVGMNRSAFCSYFKRHKGKTFSQFITRYRLNTACELLKHSQKQVSEICYMVGFNDLPHFIRSFTKNVGVSPSKYRKNNQ